MKTEQKKNCWKVTQLQWLAELKKFVLENPSFLFFSQKMPGKPLSTDLLFGGHICTKYKFV